MFSFPKKSKSVGKISSCKQNNFFLYTDVFPYFTSITGLERFIQSDSDSADGFNYFYI